MIRPVQHRRTELGRRMRMGVAMSVAMTVGIGALTGLVPTAATAGDPEVILRGDGTYENAIAWQYEGAALPDYGAFAVRFPESTTSVISGLVLDVTGAPPALVARGARMDLASDGHISNAGTAVSGDLRMGKPVGQDNGAEDSTPPSVAGSALVDVYVWDEAEGSLPGVVVHLETGVSLEVSSAWPEFSRAVLAIDPPVRCQQLTGGAAWAGFWGNWANGPAGAFVGADQDGFGTAGLTLITPGLGFPSGWQETSVAFPGVTALGIGILAEPCGLEPVLPSTWGSIKRQFHRRS